MKAIGIVFTTMWKHEVLKQAQVPARDQASARRQSAENDRAELRSSS